MRSHYCGQVDKSLVDQEVTLCGWVHSYRDHGGLIFIDLRDCAGIVQIVFDPVDSQAFALAESIRNEYVLRVTGQVRQRPAGTENPGPHTGPVEVVGARLEILNESDVLPFPLDHPDGGEAVRL